MARGYPQAPSASPGTTLTVHVASDAPLFRLDFFRQGGALAFAGSSPWYAGPAPAGTPASTTDFGWTGFGFDVPPDWVSGVYVAVIVEWDGTGSPPPVAAPPTGYASDGQLLFVLKSASPGAGARVVYKLSLFTFHAYNVTGGGSLYAGYDATQSVNPPGGKVTVLRPGGGTGGDLAFPDPDPYDPSLHPQTFWYWDAPFIGWLEGRGDPVEYCTDLDIHSDPALLPNYRLLLSVGHDEYWSAPMRSAIEAFVGNGGNVAFFSGDTCWWRVNLVDNDTAMVVYKTGHGEDDQWWDGWAHSPENSLTGVSYRNGGGWYDGKRDQVGYTVQFADHWVFLGTGLTDGEVIGNTVVPPVVGYECDGAQYTTDGAGHAVPTGSDGTPGDFTILGVGVLTPVGSGGWQVEQLREGDAPSPYAATMGIRESESAGTVFTAATCEWPRVVASGGDPAITAITGNVLTRLAAPLSVPAGMPAALGSSGNTAAEAIVSVADGGVRYTWWQLGGAAKGFLNLGGQFAVAPAVALTGDSNNHLFVAASDADGNLSLNQGVLGRYFTGWQDVGFQSSLAPSMAASGDTVALAAVRPDGGVSYTWWNPGGSAATFADLGGQTADAPAAALAGAQHDYLFVVARDLNGDLFLTQGQLGGPFTGFADDLGFAASAPAAMSSSADITALVGVGTDRSVSYTWWQFGQQYQPWTVLDGKLTGAAPAAALVGAQHDYLFVVIQASDGGLWLNQGTLGGAFTGWQPR
jgi:hypothetical protein